MGKKKQQLFTTTTDTEYIRVYANIWYGYGTFWFDDIELYESGSNINLVENPSFESIYNANDYPCSGFRIDSLSTNNCWAEIENHRREHWEYADHPLIFEYQTKQPVLLGTLSQYDYLASLHKNMTDIDKRVDANIFKNAYSFYGHLIDVLGSEVWELQMDDNEASLRRTISYKKTNRNLLQWTRHGSDSITHEEVENYMNDQMFYGMFPSISVASQGNSGYWSNAMLYERDRDLFKKYIPIIKNISAAGWEPIPYMTCNNPDIKFERYGLYYTVSTENSIQQNCNLVIDVHEIGFGNRYIVVEELTKNNVNMYNVNNGKIYLNNINVKPNKTLVFKLSD